MVSNPVDQDVKTLVEMLEKYNVGLTYIYKGKGSGKVVEVSMTSDEIRQAAKGAVVGANADEMLQMQIDVTNGQFPVDLGNGMMMTRLVREGNVVYYEYTCDESMISVKQISQNKKQVVDEIRKELENGIATDPSVKTFLQICKNADCDLGYRYVGSKTGTVAEAVLPLDDLDLE